MSRDIAPFGLRMQAELKARLEAAAVASGRSLNAELVARLQQSFGEERPGSASLPTGALIEELVRRLGAKVQIVVSPAEAERAGITPTGSD